MKYPEWLELELEAERIALPSWRDVVCVVLSFVALGALGACLIMMAPK